jgi:hypothetical protein
MLGESVAADLRLLATTTSIESSATVTKPAASFNVTSVRIA